jgi:hypothetical protein
MGRISIAVKHLLTCGASHEAVVAAIEEMEAVGRGLETDGVPVELLSRRAHDRERQARHRSRDVTLCHVTNVTPPPLSPPMINNSTPPIPTPKLSVKPPENPLFEEFWKVYPRKVGKGEARKAWIGAIKRATPEEIIAGAKRYAATKPDPEYTKHPGPWLNADRWLDEGSKVIEFAGPRRTWAEIKAEREGSHDAG